VRVRRDDVKAGASARTQVLEKEEPLPPAASHLAKRMNITDSRLGRLRCHLGTSFGPLGAAAGSVIVDPEAPSTVYAIANGGGLLDPPAGLYRTIGAAANWSALPVPSAVGPFPFSVPTCLTIHP